MIIDHVYPDLELEKELLGEGNNIELLFLDSKDETTIAEAVVDADAVITCYAEITAGIIKSMRQCKSISKTGIGVNNIDVAQATRQGIRVLNVPDYCVEEVSDTTLALVLSLTRCIPHLANNIKAGQWSLSGCEHISRMKGKVFGILGFGRIARLVVKKVRPYGVRVVAYDPYVTAEIMGELGVTKLDFDDLIMESDIVSLHLPLTEESKGIINERALSMMKPNALLINTSRGPLISESDLYEALRAGNILGAGLDVLCREEYDKNNRLFDLPNALITPHAAFYSIEATQELREKIIADVLAVIAGEEPRYQVNSFEKERA